MSTKILISVLFALLSISSIDGQTEVKRTSNVCTAEYNDVIDDLFSEGFSGWGNGFAMSLRYSPPNRPEVQINIIRSAPGKFDAFIFRAKNKSILLQLQDILEKKPELRFSEVLKQIKFEKIRLSMSEAEVLSVRDGFLKATASHIEFQTKQANNVKASVDVYYDRAVYDARFYGAVSINMSGEAASLNDRSSDAESLFIKWVRKTINEIADVR